MANIKRANTSGITKTGTAISDVPDAPTIGAATNVGTSRAYNNGSATVAYTAAATGGTVVTFTATSSPGSFTATGASPITVTGLQSNTAYTFTVKGTNTTAIGPVSAASSSITATTVPQAPTIGTATLSTNTASVTFTAGATGGAAVSTFTATSSPGSITGTSATSPITVSGLSYSTAYTFTVTATNANGTSTASSASNSVTPEIPQAGYIVGGYTYSNSTRHASTLKMLFSDETMSTLAATLSESRSSSSGYANSGTAGYNTGGYRNTSSYTSIIEKITFSSEALSVLSTVLTVQNLNLHATFANSGTAGYTAGGKNSIAGEPRVSTLNKLTFSNDTNSAIGATFQDPDSGGGLGEWSGFANSGTAGYAGGGYNSDYRSRIFKLTFSNDTSSILSNRLSQSKEGLMGAANSGTAGYFAGGYVSGIGETGVVEKITFSTDARSVLGTAFSTGWEGAGFAKSGTAGYFVGGITGGSTALNRVNKLTFSSDTTSTAANTLTQARAFPAAFANSGTL